MLDGRYGLYLFIGGLDKHEGDSHDQADLVKEIQDWSCEGKAKMVYSACLIKNTGKPLPIMREAYSFTGTRRRILWNLR
ncbi:hypothetical protein BDW75DRAFT_196246 [Aspergillus navahoensis]